MSTTQENQDYTSEEKNEPTAKVALKAIELLQKEGLKSFICLMEYEGGGISICTSADEKESAKLFYALCDTSKAFRRPMQFAIDKTDSDIPDFLRGIVKDLAESLGVSVHVVGVEFGKKKKDPEPEKTTDEKSV